MFYKQSKEINITTLLENTKKQIEFIFRKTGKSNMC